MIELLVLFPISGVIRMKYSRYRTICNMTILVLLCGCTSPTTWNWCWWNKDKPVERPTRVVEFWKEDVINNTRGFGGRLMFYDDTRREKERDAAVKVDGRIVIYAFDDSDYEQGSSAPEKKFIFEPEQLEKAYGKTELVGHSYSFWLPWDTNIDAPQRHLCLITKFETKDGMQVLCSAPSSVILPGTVVSEKKNKIIGASRGIELRSSHIASGEDTSTLLGRQIEKEQAESRKSLDIKGLASETPNTATAAADPSDLRRNRQTETISLTSQTAFAQPGESGTETPEPTQDKSFKILQEAAAERKAARETSTQTAGESPNAQKNRTTTILNGPLNSSPTSLDGLSNTLNRKATGSQAVPSTTAP